MAKSVRIAGIRVDLALGQAEFNKGIDEATRRLIGLNNTFKSVGDGINRAAKAIAIGYVAKQVLDLGAAIGELAEKGEVAGSIADQFQALGGSASSIDKAKKATVGLLDQYELMAVANKGLSANVAGFNENFGQVADLAARVADALGTDTAAEVDKLTNLIVKGGKGLSAYGFNLEGLKTKAEKQKAVMQQLPEVMSRYAEVTDSASNAQSAFTKQLEEGWKTVGIAINNSDGLTAAWHDMELALNAVDWAQVGSDIGDISASIAGLAADALPGAISGFRALGEAMEFIFGNRGGRASDEIERINSNIAELQVKLGNPFEWNKQGVRDQIKEQQEFLKIVEDVARAQKATGEQKQHIDDQVGYENSLKRIKDRQALQDKLDREEAARAGKSDADRVAKMQDAWKKSILGSEADSLKNSIAAAIDNQDKATFDALSAQLREKVSEGVIAGQKDAIEANAIPLSEVTAQAQKEADAVIGELAGKFVEKSEAASRESVAMWQGLFQNAITGVTFNLKDALEQVAVGFAAKLAAATFGDMGLGKIGSASDLGGALFDKLGLGDILGGGGYFEPGGAPAAGGAGLSASLMAMVPVAAAAASAYLVKSDVESIISGKADNSAKGVAGRIQSGISSGGISELARASGFFGGSKRSPEQEAIHRVAGSIEDLIKKFSTISTVDPTGKITTSATKGFNVDESLLKGDWQNEMNSWGQSARNTFNGLGEAIRAVQGITEDVGDEIGYILGKAIGGSVDSARLNVKKLGLEFEQVEEALVGLGKAEKKSWFEVETAIQGAAEAFKPGLEAIGAVTGALEEIVTSGGRGEKALKGVRDVGVEGLEAKMKTLEEAKRKMLAEGGDPEYVNALFESIAAAGIKTLQELSNVSDRVGGQIVAGIEARSPKAAAEWGKMSEELAKFGADIDGYSKKLEAMQGKVIDVTFNLTTKTDQLTEEWMDPELQSEYESEEKKESKSLGTEKKARRFAMGGIISGRTDFSFDGGLGMMGEAGPEAILPLRQKNGRLGVEVSGGSGRGAGNVTLVINAPGADAGSEERLLAIASTIQAGAIQGAVEIMSQAGY